MMDKTSISDDLKERDYWNKKREEREQRSFAENPKERHFRTLPRANNKQITRPLRLTSEHVEFQNRFPVSILHLRVFQSNNTFRKGNQRGRHSRSQQYSKECPRRRQQSVRFYRAQGFVPNYSQYDDAIDYSPCDDEIDYYQDNEGMHYSEEADKIAYSQYDDGKGDSRGVDENANSQGDDGDVGIEEAGGVYSQEDDDNDEMAEDEAPCILLEEASLLKTLSDDCIEEDYYFNVTQEDSSTHVNQIDDGTNDIREDDYVNVSQEDSGIRVSQTDDGANVLQEDDEIDDLREEETSLFSGTFETQVSEGGESDLHRHLAGCVKNPGHAQFVPVNDFNLSHLPDGYYNNDLVELIKATADLTVRVDVKMTSEGRQQCWPNTQTSYPFYNLRGSDVMRTGTGMVNRVSKFPERDVEEFKLGACRCLDCQTCDTPNQVRGYIWMSTASQVVFGDLEARHTTCRLFYDRQDSPLVLHGGWTVIDANIEEDRCRLICVTCDVELLDKLDKALTYRRDLINRVSKKYESSRGDNKLTVIVSHPHGCPKQVSVGHWINRYTVKDDLLYHKTKYTYTTSTCPGSSGANVLALGSFDEFVRDCHVHCGVNSDGTNFSGTGWEWL